MHPELIKAEYVQLLKKKLSRSKKKHKTERLLKRDEKCNMHRLCELCHKPNHRGKKARFCSERCRRKSYLTHNRALLAEASRKYYRDNRAEILKKRQKELKRKIVVHCTLDEKNAFREICKKEGKTPSSALRIFIKSEILKPKN